MKRLVYFGAAAALIIVALIVRAQAHTHAVNAAKAIVAADVAGTDTSAAAAELKAYVGHHTGASVQYSLVGSYDRAVAAAKDQAAAANGTGALYAAAQSSCSGRADSIQQAKCVQAYIASHGAAQAQAAPVTAPDPRSFIMVLRAPSLAADLPTIMTALAVMLAGIGIVMWRRK